MASEIVKTSTVSVYQPGTDWQTLIDQSDEILGYDLARDETADDLIGVPFAITRVRFHPGIIRNKVQAAFVSCETRIAPTLDLRLINPRRVSSGLSRLTTLDDLAFGPDSHVLFNDGSTGVYRQIVKYLLMKEYIKLPLPLIEGGPSGESSFDIPPSGWASIDEGEEIPGDVFTGYVADIRLYCPRGLRLSTYENESAPGGSRTRYIG
jgi:hypothetical protein